MLIFAKTYLSAMFPKLAFTMMLLAAGTATCAQDVDVQQYKFRLWLSDTSNRIQGETHVEARLASGATSFTLDLIQARADGKGMTVTGLSGHRVKSWKQEDNKIHIALTGPAIDQETYQIAVLYQGVPADGLIISRNRYGQRTFFADNWPDRARHWIPCNDRPDDKARFSFEVQAPAHYRVVSNGLLETDTSAANAPYRNIRITRWKESAPQPTKVMVIGAAQFAVKTFSDSPNDIPVSAWVYPQDSAKGFYDYALAPSILKYFSSYIAPFPYQKLANVQSKTIFGGMENASAIFYAEESVTGDRKWEDVIAHEIAHQWFGDMASEKSFAHLWLSEGFATYLTHLYIGQKYGADSMRRRLHADRLKIIGFLNENPRPLVDSTPNLMSLLNANSYEKGSWVLHMLRMEVGDSVFRKILQAYYHTYKGGNAETRDFMRVADSVYVAAGRVKDAPASLVPFFEQWLYRPGVPRLRFERSSANGYVTFKVFQEGPLYDFPLEVGIRNYDGTMEIRRLRINRKETVVFEGLLRNFSAIGLDPDVKLLFDGPHGNFFWKRR